MPKALLAMAIEAGDERRMISVGLARTGIDVAIFGEEDRRLPPGAVGEVVVRGDTVMAGDPLLRRFLAPALRLARQDGDPGVPTIARFLTSSSC